jgi:hypothetical protein
MDFKNVVKAQAILPSRPCAAISLTLLLFLLISTALAQQRQLVVLKNEEVLARYQVGDVIHFARENDKEVLVQRILDMNDTLLMMNFDSVNYYHIKKLDIRARKSNTFVQKLGRFMIIAGVLLPAIELLNTGVFNDEGQGANISSEVLVVSGVLIGGGAIMAFTKKAYFKPGRKNHLMIVDKRSPFYKAKPIAEGYLSPYIPRN